MWRMSSWRIGIFGLFVTVLFLVWCCCAKETFVVVGSIVSVSNWIVSIAEIIVRIVSSFFVKIDIQLINTLVEVDGLGQKVCWIEISFFVDTDAGS